MLLLLWISLLSSVFGVMLTESCDENEFEECKDEADFSYDFDFDITNEEFKKTCEKKMKSVRCIKEYEKNCQEINPLKINLPLMGREQVVELFCPGETEDLTDDILLYNCEGMMSNFDYCNEKFKESLKEIHGSNIEPKMKASQSCCALNWMKTCKLTSINLRCNPEEQMLIGIPLADSLLKFTKICGSVASSIAHSNCTELYGVKVDDLEMKFSKSTSINSPYIVLLFCFVFIKMWNPI